MWSPGQRIGDYELVAKLREGGMATLFLGRRSGVAGFSRHVAIKVIHPDLAYDEQFRQMFLDEAVVSSRIHHPNVVHVEELGQHAGAHYLTMEFVHGCSLSQLQRALLARARRLAPAVATRIAIEVAEGLHAAHETEDERGQPLNVVHRDVTPENILLAYAGHVKLIDFGIAKAYGRRHRTMDGLLKGKFRYMAPEQALGKPVDRRVDVYQLGIVLWEMLTLRRLFDAAGDADLLAMVQRPRVVPPSALVPGIPPSLDAALMGALEPQLKRRTPDALTFARMLAKAMPAVHEVDAGTLRELLLAVMQEQRTRESTTYPPGVYEILDNPESARMPHDARAPHTMRAPMDVRAALMRHTVDHARPARRTPSPGDGITRGGKLARQREQLRRPLRPDAPPRARLVRLASELRTTLTSFRGGELPRGRGIWLALGGGFGLAIVLVLLLLVLAPTPRPVPRLPVPPLPAASTAAGTQPAAIPHGTR